MHILADHRFDDLVPVMDPPGWRPPREHGLSPPDSAVWAIFGGGSRPWTAVGPALGPLTSCLLVTDDAPVSQFVQATEALGRGEALPAGLVCLARAGTGFRGQRGRPWTALRGNLHLTAHYRLDTPASSTQAMLTALPAVAAAEAIEEVGAAHWRPEIKWVNDVLIDGRKVAGVLTSTQVQGSCMRSVVFGVGINVARAPVLEARPGTVPPGSLADADPAGSACLPLLLGALVRRLEAGVEDAVAGRTESWIERYRARSCVVGREVEIWPEDGDRPDAGPAVVGRVRRLLPDLALEMEGGTHPVRRGRLVFR